MPGVVADDEHFVAQRGHEEQVHLGEDARHFLRDFAAEAVGLDKIHGGEDDTVAAGGATGERRLVFHKAGVFGYHGLP